MDASVKAILTGQQVIGVLGRDITVRLLEISRSGCLLESPCAVASGTIGSLAVHIDGQEYADEVRVARCTVLAGAGDTHHVGAEFLTLRTPSEYSLRRYAASLTGESMRPEGPLSFRPRAS